MAAGMAPRFLLLAVSLLLGGCATLNKGECQTVDWHELGQRDGRDGHARARLAEHAEACGKHGISPDAEAYFAGREIGLLYYCTPEAGFEAGLAGQPYRDVCPLDSERDFLREHERGYLIYQLRRQLEDLDRSIASLEAELDQEDLDRETRNELRVTLREQRRERRHLERELLAAEIFLTPRTL